MKRSMLVLWTVAGLFGCGSDGMPPPGMGGGTVTLGYVTLASSFAPAYVDTNSKMLELATDAINKGGGVMGKTLAVDVQEADGSIDSSVTVADRMKMAGYGQVILCNFSRVGGHLGAKAVADGFLLVALGNSSTIREVADPQNFLWWIAPDIRVWGVAHAEHLERAGRTKLAIVYGEDVINQDVANVLEQAWIDRGHMVTDKIEYPEPEAGMTLMTTSILQRAFDAAKAADAIMVYPLSDADTSQLVLDAKASGHDPKAFVIDENSASEDFIAKVSPQNAEGIGGVVPVLAQSQSLSTVEQAYQQAYNSDIAQKTDTVTAYDQVFLVAMAMERAGKVEAAAVRDAMARQLDPSGEVVLAGEWAKAKMLIAAGKPIQYKGASGLLIDVQTGENRTNTFDDFTIRSGMLAMRGSAVRCTYTPGAGSTCQPVTP